MHGVNARGCYACVHYSLNYMLKQKDMCTIIVVSPPIYNRFFKGKTPYSMSKVAMTVLVKGLAHELEGTNVRAVSLWPATGIESAATNRFKS